ncbi:MAG: arginase family protein [Nanoarchaeota archaeon]|nr:arginase family protein [Nanoarchaeota archaeon]
MRILKVAYNGGGLSKKEGVEKAPEIIVTHLKQANLNEAELLPVFDFVDVKVENDNIENSRKIMKSMASSIPFIAIGGDHSITGPLFETNARENSGIIIFDAHPDLVEGKNSHEDWLRSLIEEGKVKPQNVILVGIRNSHIQEVDFIKKYRLNTYSMKEISHKGVNETCDSVMSAARSWDSMYISVDIDVLDPAFAPGTGYTEPGGLTTRELLYFLQRLRLLKNFMAADVVEVNPDKDVNEITSKAASKIVIELA